jgi:hypothetical protein
MLRSHRWWTLLVVIAGLVLSGCQQRSSKPPTEHPAEVEPIPGTALSRIILTEHAIQRIGLKTDLVRVVQVAKRLDARGEILAVPAGKVAGPGSVWVRVSLSERDRQRVDRSQPALVAPLDRDDGEENLTAQPVGMPAERALYYAVDGTRYGLVPGQDVRVELARAGRWKTRTAVPYSALIYDTQGETWVYTSPAPRTFVRHKVDVDDIEGDVAVLDEGPPIGTVVVSVGVAELYGAETKVGH